jgi:hypothetical protein
LNLGIAWQAHASFHFENLCVDAIFCGNISGDRCQGDLEQVLVLNRSLSLNYIIKLDLVLIMVLFIVLLDSLPYDSKLSGEESFLQDYLLELHIRQGYVHDL